MRHLRLMLLLATATASGCADSVINDLEPVNQETVTSVADSFSYIATDLKNVTDRVTYGWVNSQERLTLVHQSFLPHGYGLLVILDAAGFVVDSTLLEYDLTTESRAGVPGLWTVILIYTNAWGRAQFTLTPLTGDPLAEGRTASVVEAAPGTRRPASGVGALRAWAKEADDDRRRH
jgi:hypothetical protein